MGKARQTASNSKSVELRIIPALLPLAVPIGTLHLDADNVRVHSERNIDAIKASFERFGQQVPVVFVLRGKRRVVIKGNGMLQAAKALGWTEIAAVASNLADNDAVAFAIADNRISDLSEFDQELLAAQLQELECADYDLDATGFNEEELLKLVEQVDDPQTPRPPTADGDKRKRGPKMIRFVLGQFTFDVERQTYDAWLSAIESKTGSDADQVIKELKRRLKLTSPS